MSRSIAQCLLMLCLACYSMASMAWFDCQWPYRTELTVSENSGTTLSNYQVRINLTAASMDGDYVWSSNGNDLRILDTDDSTQLSFFIESWNAGSQTATVWVQFNTLTANSNRLIYLYYGNTSATTASTPLIFTDPGIKFNTRRTTANPSNKTQAFNAYNSAPVNTNGYGCTFITNFTGVNNRNQFGPPNRNDNFVAYSESFFEVAPGEAGVWGFRYGADFGRGGGLYVDDIALEEQWNDDLWWGFNWGASTEILQGSINLSEGFHKLEIIGFEGCCDGGITVQYSRPGGSFQTFNTSTINVASRKCPVTDPSLVYGASGSQLPALSILQSSQVIFDPFNLNTNPKAIPGARVRQQITISNTGIGSPDENAVQITYPIPNNSSLYVNGSPFTFNDGATSSGLSFNYISPGSTTDNVEFSNDNAASFNYTPTAGADGSDVSVTHVRITPSGKMNCNNGGTPSFIINLETLLN